MGEFDTIYTLAKIYGNSEASEPDNVNAEPKSNITLQVSKITNPSSDFTKICKPFIRSK